MLGGLDYRSSKASVRAAMKARLLATGIISADDDFGCRGDDVTDNWPMLKIMRDFMRANDRAWTVNFAPGGVYRYSRNHWVKGVLDLTLNAEDCTFKCTHAGGGFDADMCPFRGNWGVFNNSGYETYDAATTVPGYLFNTIDADNTALTMTTAAQAANFAAGDPVLIYGFATQDNSFPPNPRFFEWNAVESVNVGAGTVTLKNPLEDSYDSRWHDFGGPGYGKPYLLNLSRGANIFTQARSLRVNGGYFAPNPNDTARKEFATEGYDRVVLNRVRALGFTPSMAQYCEMIDCDFEAAEYDKIVKVAVSRGGRLKDFSAATGIKRVELLEGVHLQGICTIMPSELVIDGAVIETESSAGADHMISLAPAYTMICADIRAAKLSCQGAALKNLIGGGVETTFTISSVSSNTKVLVLCANDAAFEALYQSIRHGFTYALQSGAKRVKITKIYDEDATHTAIEGQWSAAPIAAEVYRGASLERLVIGPSIDQVGPQAPVRMLGAPRLNYQHVHARDGDYQRLYFTERDNPLQASASAYQSERALQDYIMRGYLARIWVNVVKAYTGVDAVNTLIIQARTPAVVSYAQVNLKTAGAREVTAFATAGAVAGDTLAATAAAYVDTLRIINNGGGVSPTYADATEMAKYQIVIELAKSPG